MARQYVYTSTLPLELKEELEQYASKHKISKNKIIEKALTNLFEQEVRRELMESFKKIANDSDLIETAEWGMEDYAEQLKNYKK